MRLATRSGTGPEHPAIKRVQLDASNVEALTQAADGAAVLYNCANPGSYTAWASQWPPLAAAALEAAERTGATLVICGNLYGYGPVEGRITRDLPLRPSDHKGVLRARIWENALAAHQAGRVLATEVRASDYLGPAATPANGLLARYAEATLAGKTARVIGDPDQPHTWTAIDDIAATLARVGEDERAWGSPWLVPSNPPATVREVLRQLGERVGAGEPRLRPVPRGVLVALGVVIPILREVTGVLYQFERPFVADAAETTATFGIQPTPWEALLDATAHAWFARGAR